MPERISVPRARAAKAATSRKRRRDELILDALEKLLADTPLRDLGVEEIADAAGITRTRFYHYYKSKYEALAALLGRISDEVLDVYASPGSWFVRPPEVRPRASFEETFPRILDVWFKHGAVLRESADIWNAVPEVRERWEQIVNGLVERMRVAIERERTLGVAPPGPPAHQLAEGLIWAGERVQFLTLIGAPGAMSVDELADVGTAMVMRTIYLADDPDPQ